MSLTSNRATLTKGQQAALEAVRSGRNVFITGGGGVGKSYLTRVIIDELEACGKKVMITASTGLAATLIGGVTCHRAFQIPLTFAWTRHPAPPDEMLRADAIVIDEVSMLRMDTFDYIVKCVQKIYKEHGYKIQLIVVGDFCQLPPVLAKRSKTESAEQTTDEKELLSQHYGFDVGQAYAFEAPGWEWCDFVVCELTESLRQTDAEMIAALNKIRVGDWSGLDYFREHSRKEKFDQDEAVCLCGNNKSAEALNRSAIERLPGECRTYRAEVGGIVSASDKPVPDELKLKIGAQVIMVQNSDKYVNGSYATIEEMYEWGVTVKVRETGELVDVEPAEWSVNQYVVRTLYDGKKNIDLEQIGYFVQLPLKPAYAITIHKSQGQTFDRVILSIGSRGKKGKYPRLSIFAYGQLYVALSRVRSIDGLYIEGDLRAVKLLAAPEVQRFYGINTSGLPSGPTPAKPKEQPESKAAEKKLKPRTRKKSTGTRKTAAKKTAKTAATGTRTRTRKTAATGRKQSTAAEKMAAKKATGKTSTTRKTATKTSRRTTKKSTEMGRKTAAPVRMEAAEKVGSRANDGLVPVHCTENTVRRVWDFASRLTPECQRDGLDIRVPVDYQKRVERAEKILRGVWES